MTRSFDAAGDLSCSKLARSGVPWPRCNLSALGPRFKEDEYMEEGGHTTENDASKAHAASPAAEQAGSIASSAGNVSAVATAKV
jgi:hypothetical protein